MKSVIITGATRGIGLALARFYADKGDTTVDATVAGLS